MKFLKEGGDDNVAETIVELLGRRVGGAVQMRIEPLSEPETVSGRGQVNVTVWHSVGILAENAVKEFYNE